MKHKYLSKEQIAAYGAYLRREEKSQGTIEKYMRDVIAFTHFLNGAPVSKEITSAWKISLQEKGYAPVTI